MKYSFLFLAPILFSGLFFYQKKSVEMNSPNPTWSAIDSLEKIGKLQSALELTENMLEHAWSQKDRENYIRAVLYRNVYYQNLYPDQPKRVVEAMESEIDRCGEIVSSVLHSILGGFYISHYRSRMWQINRRTEVEGAEGENMATWTARQYLENSAHHYFKSLESNATAEVEIKTLGWIIEGDSIGKKLRPNLRHLLQTRALEFILSANQFQPVAVPALVVNDKSWFSDAEQFIAIDVTDEAIPDFDYSALAISLYQQFIGEAIQSGRIDILADIDLHRIKYMSSVCRGATCDDYLIEALYRLSDTYSETFIQAEILFEIAKYYHEKAGQFNNEPGNPARGYYLKAMEYIEKVLKKWPDTYGADLSKNLRSSILQPGLDFNMDQVISTNRPFLASIQYKNLEGIKYKVFRISRDDFYNWNQFDGARLRAVLDDQAHFISEEIDLPNDQNHHEHRTEIPLPALKGGFYLITIQGIADGNIDNPYIKWSYFQVSDIALLNLDLNFSNHSIVVLDRNTGAPVEGAGVEIMNTEYIRRDRITREVVLRKGLTDAMGVFELREENRRNRFFPRITFENDTLYGDNSYFIVPERSRQRAERVDFFLDRSVYRPGQVIYFKGVAIAPKGDVESIPVENKKVNIVVRDVNRREVYTATKQTNEYGAFWGSFTVPGGLRGRMTLSVEGFDGRGGFSVEEYKRPVWFAEFEKFEGELRPGDTIEVKGQARAYAGFPIADARVNYRITRRVSFPFWQYPQRFFPGHLGGELELDFGTTNTDRQGNFVFDFKAEPPVETENCQGCILTYLVRATITDQAGETHTAERTVNISDHPVQLDVGFSQKLNSANTIEGIIQVKNLDQVPISRQLKIELAEIQIPKPLPYPRKWSKPTHFLLEKTAFKEQFPLHPFGEEDDSKTWPTLPPVLQRTEVVEGEMSLRLPRGLKSGLYRLVIRDVETDEFPILYSGDFEISDFSAGRFPGNKHFDFHLSAQSFQPGDLAKINIGASQTLQNIILLKENPDGTFEMLIRQPLDEKLQIDQSVENQHRGGIYHHYAAMANGRLFSSRVFMPVPFENKVLKIEPVSMNNEPDPGSRQQWQFRVTDVNGNPVAGRMLASMYDKSLDDILPHSWNINLFSTRRSFVNLTDPFGGSASGRGWWRFDRHHPVRSKNYPNIKLTEPFFQTVNYRMGLTSQYRTEGMLAESPESAEDLQFDSAVPDGDAAGVKSEVADDTQGELSDPSVRENFDETVFFFPDIEADEDGIFSIDFEMGEALTEWKLQILGLTSEFMHGKATYEVTTSSELIVMPNWPRFFMQGDQMGFPVRLINTTDNPVSGILSVKVTDAIYGGDITDDIVEYAQMDFALQGGDSDVVIFDFKIGRDIVSLLDIEVSGRSENAADGEKKLMPVLSSDIWLTQSYPVFLKPGEKVSMNVVTEQGTRPNHNQTNFEYTSDPFWLAMKSLPYISGDNPRNALQYFRIFYLNSMTEHIFKNQPELKNHLKNWIQTDALESELARNEELKTLDLDNTPWLRDAIRQTESRQKLAQLLNSNQVQAERMRAIRELSKLQKEDGSFGWFPGGPSNWFITQEILSGFARLHQSGVDLSERETAGMIRKALEYCEDEAKKYYNKYHKNDPPAEVKTDRTISSGLIQFLFVKSLLEPWAVDFEEWEGIYQLGIRDWPKMSPLLQSMLGLIFSIHQDDEVARTISESLKERSRYESGLGRFLLMERSINWYMQPLDAHAAVIQLWSRTGGFEEEISEIREWLLNHRRVNDWGTTATTARVIESLMTGRESGKTTSPVDRILVNGERLPSGTVSPESGTAYFIEPVQPRDGTVKIEIENTGSEISWGALYHQYFQDIAKVEMQHSDLLPLSIERKWMVEEHSSRGKVLRDMRAGEKLKVGQVLVGRIIIRSDRPMEYIHLQDIRPSCLEPGNVLSRYMYSEGMLYYFTSGDSSTDFFIERLPRGEFVLEYRTTIAYEGTFNAGLIKAQSYFAPEFVAYGKGGGLKIGD